MVVAAAATAVTGGGQKVILLGGHQQPVYGGVRGVMCVREKNEERLQVGIHWPEKTTSNSCVV